MTSWDRVDPPGRGFDFNPPLAGPGSAEYIWRGALPGVIADNRVATLMLSNSGDRTGGNGRSFIGLAIAGLEADFAPSCSSVPAVLQMSFLSVPDEPVEDIPVALLASAPGSVNTEPADAVEAIDETRFEIEALCNEVPSE